MRRSLVFLLVLFVACQPANPPVIVEPQAEPAPTSPIPSEEEDAKPLPNEEEKPRPIAPTGDVFAVVTTPPPLPNSTLASLASTLGAIIANTSATSSVYIVDADNGQEIYAHSPDLPLKPASNTKLFTTATAFGNLGEAHRMEVRVYQSGTGLTIINEHDFTWSTLLYPSTSFAAERIVDRIQAAGVTSVGALTIAGSYLVQGASTGTLDEDNERQLGADLLAATLEARGITVASVALSESLAPPAGAKLIAKHLSQPLSTAVHPLNVYSHNEFADMLARHNGYLLRNGDSYAEGAAAAKEWLVSIGIDATGFELHDGSGLSHSNRVTARQVVHLFRYMLAQPYGQAWLHTMSIAGVIGTLENRMSDQDTSARFFGKTGTLNKVIATSGVLFHSHDGHRYLVSILMNDVANATEARSAEDAIVTALAHDKRQLGARPALPVLRSMRSLGDGRIAFGWDGATSVDLWLSTDGTTWDRANARRVNGSTHVAADLASDTTYYAKVIATNGAGESEPSNVLSASTRLSKPTLLVVDGFDRWQNQGENPLGRGHDFVAAHARALGRRSFDSVSHTAILAGEVTLTDYKAVLWVLGEESTADETFNDQEQSLVSSAIARGVHFFASGSELAWDLDNKGSSTDKTFAHDVLHMAYVADDAATKTVSGAAGGIFHGLNDLGFNRPGNEDVAYPDRLAVSAGSKVELSYTGGDGGVAAVSFAGPAKVVVFGFPFEALDSNELREQVMSGVLAFMGQ